MLAERNLYDVVADPHFASHFAVHPERLADLTRPTALGPIAQLDAVDANAGVGRAGAQEEQVRAPVGSHVDVHRLGPEQRSGLDPVDIVALGAWQALCDGALFGSDLDGHADQVICHLLGCVLEHFVHFFLLGVGVKIVKYYTTRIQICQCI